MTQNALTDFDVGHRGAQIDIEARAKTPSEILSGVFIEGEFPGREHLDPVDLLGRALRLRIEAADGLDLIIEEFDAIGLAAPHGPEIEDRAAHGELPRLPDLIGQAVSGVTEELAKAGGIKVIADGQVQALAPDPGRRSEPLDDGRHRGDHDALIHSGKPGEKIKSARYQVRVRRVEVVGQDFPVREQLDRWGIELLQIVSELPRRIAVGGNHENRSPLAPRQTGQCQCQAQTIEPGPVRDLGLSRARRVENRKGLGHGLVKSGKPRIVATRVVPIVSEASPAGKGAQPGQGGALRFAARMRRIAAS